MLSKNLQNRSHIATAGQEMQTRKHFVCAQLGSAEGGNGDHEGSERGWVLKTSVRLPRALIQFCRDTPDSHEHQPCGNTGPELWPHSPADSHGDADAGAEDNTRKQGWKGTELKSRSLAPTRPFINLNCFYCSRFKNWASHLVTL